jgi:hypothetical protein
MKQRSLFLCISLLVALSLLADDPAYRVTNSTLSASGAGPAISLVGLALDYHRLAFYPVGTISSCSVKLEQSVNGVSGWTDLIAATTCTTAGISSLANAIPQYVRVNATFSGGGTLRLAVLNYRGNPETTGGGGSGGTVDQGTPGASAWLVDGSGVTQPVSASSLPLPSGAATESTLSGIKTGTDKIPASPATDRSTAAAPFSARLSDGSAFYKATTPSDTQPISAASLPLPTGAALDATISTMSGKLPAALDGSGFLKTHEQGTSAVSAASLPLPSGASTAAKQPALGTAGAASSDVITVQGIASMTPILIDGTAGTQPVSAAALPLPSGAATSAKQPALGTAGSASADVVTVQGVASMTALKVDGSASTQPVSGTVAATESGTWTVQPGNTANTTAWKVDGSAVTQPVSGTVTANAGTNLNTSALALESGGNLATVASTVRAEDSISADADKGLTVFAVRKATPANTSGTDGDYEALQISAGRLWTSTTIDAALPSGSNVIGHTIADSGSTTAVTGNVTVIQGTGTNLHTVSDSGTITTVSTVTNLSQLGGVAVAMNTGTRSTGTQRVTIATDDVVPASQSGTWTVQPGNTANTTAWLTKLDQTTTNNDVDVASIVPGTGATNQGKAEDAAHTTGDVGIAELWVRKDNATQNTNADSDYTNPSADAYGAIFARSDHPNRIRCTVNASTATILTAMGGSCATPGAGLSLYITDIHFSTSAAAGTAADSFPTLKYGTGGTCGSGTVIFWGALTGANTTVVDDLTTPIKIPANNEVCFMMSTAGTKNVVLTGYIAP